MGGGGREGERKQGEEESCSKEGKIMVLNSHKDNLVCVTVN